MKIILTPVALPGTITHGNLLALLSAYKRPNDKIAYMIEKGELISIKKGLYFFSEAYKNGDSSSFQAANVIYGPSYVSLYSALAYYGLIPESVNIIESITTKRSNFFSTSIGNFKYFSGIPSVFHIGINYKKWNDKIAFLLASPTKALCDIIWQTSKLNINSTTEMETFLEYNMRFDMDRINELKPSEIEACIKSNRKKKLLEYLEKVILCESS